MINTPAPSLYTPRTVFSSVENGKLEVTTGYLHEAPSLLGALATASTRKPLKQGNDVVPIILAGGFDMTKKTVNLQVLPESYNDMKKAVINYSDKLGIDIVNIK